MGPRWSSLGEANRFLYCVCTWSWLQLTLSSHMIDAQKQRSVDLSGASQLVKLKANSITDIHWEHLVKPHVHLFRKSFFDHLNPKYAFRSDSQCAKGCSTSCSGIQEILGLFMWAMSLMSLGGSTLNCISEYFTVDSGFGNPGLFICWGIPQIVIIWWWFATRI